MSTSTILVIDDSATIRKMVDSHLSQEGYRVVLAQNGELGIEMVREIIPDLILLDHQLPGTTGIEVCRKIIQFPECRLIPFVISSTLRKQAYIEYMDVPNVVDSLPKPFTPNLLKMAVANALETGAMIVASQTNGTAVPEVVGETEQPALSGDFRWLGLREVIDFLNNGRKTGMLEVETSRNRVCFFLKDGRIQGVVSPSFDPVQIADRLPKSLSELTPLLQFTLSSGTSTRVDGLVELMDKKVLDPRMLRTLLRHQAAALTQYCFTSQPNCFSFHPERALPALFTKVSIDTSLAGILVDGTLNSPSKQDLSPGSPVGWVRNGLRGQNLDRAGLSATHIQLLSHLDSTPRNTAELAAKAGLPLAEAHAVLEGFLQAEWVRSETLTQTRTLIAYEPDTQHGAVIRNVIDPAGNGWTGNIVRDEFSLQLLLKRKTPDAVLIALQGETELNLPEILKNTSVLSGPCTVVLIAPASSPPLAAALQDQRLVRRPYTTADILTAINGSPQKCSNYRNDVKSAATGNNAEVFCAFRSKLMQSTTCENLTIATLHLIRPGQPRTTQVIREGECLAVGSDPGADICLFDDQTASTHCMISARGGFITVRDCFSETGTFVDKTRIRETQLMTDAEIRMGRSSILVKLNNHIVPQRNVREFDSPVLEPAARSSADISATASITNRNESTKDGNAESLLSKIGDLKMELEQAHAEIQVLQTRLKQGSNVVAPAVDPYQDEMIELLRAEVLDLQAALADRERISSENVSAEQANSCSDDVLSKPDAEKLVDRLEQLLLELKQRDDQIATLTELLEAAEAANRAEMEERTQIDSWLRDIEQRCGDREHEWRSQQTKLQSELEAIAAERDLAETALSAGSSGVKLEAAQNVMTSLRETAELQRRKLHDAEQTIDQLQRQLDAARNAQPREEQMQLAEERAEIARLRQELELERQRRQNPAANDNNLKLQALRQHLNEIHKHEQKEREEREERKLSSRIARLWHRLEGR